MAGWMGLLHLFRTSLSRRLVPVLQTKSSYMHAYKNTYISASQLSFIMDLDEVSSQASLVFLLPLSASLFRAHYSVREKKRDVRECV